MLSVSSQQGDTPNPDDSEQKDGAHELALWDGRGAATSATSLEAPGRGPGLGSGATRVEEPRT